MIPVKENWKLHEVVWLSHIYDQNSMFIFLAPLFIVKKWKNTIFTVPRIKILYQF